MISILKSTSQHIKDHSILFVFLQLAYCPLILIPFHLWLALIPTNRHSFFFYFFRSQGLSMIVLYFLLFHFPNFPLNKNVIVKICLGFQVTFSYIYCQNSKQNTRSNFLLMFTIYIVPLSTLKLFNKLRSQENLYK